MHESIEKITVKSTAGRINAELEELLIAFVDSVVCKLNMNRFHSKLAVNFQTQTRSVVYLATEC